MDITSSPMNIEEDSTSPTEPIATAFDVGPLPELENPERETTHCY